MCLRQDASNLHYSAISPKRRGSKAPPLAASTLEPLSTYLNLKPDLGQLYEQWSRADPNFKKKALQISGVRILRQDPWETLCGFICSSNNNIIRISQMMNKLCVKYGTPLGSYQAQDYWTFPPPSALSGTGVEAELRELGFGYRAKYLHRTAVIVDQERPAGWLESLMNTEKDSKISIKEEADLKNLPRKGVAQVPEGGRPGYREAHEQLLELQGVGPKVADCVCLFGLGWGEAVPVDTHVWQIAQRDYKFGKGKHASLTKTTYDAIGNRFRELWGDEAGWAHSVLFTADLRAFSDLVGKGKGKMETVGVVEVNPDVKVKQEVKVEAEEDAADDQERDVKALERSPDQSRKRRRSLNGQAVAEDIKTPAKRKKKRKIQ